MFATLTLPAGYEDAEPRRTPTARVNTAVELRTALRHARECSVRVDGRGMNRVLRLDAAQGVVEVQAATEWEQLARYLAPRRIALEAFAKSGLPATVGESVSQAAPGPDGLPVSAHVTALTVVTADGELRRADRFANQTLFRLVLGGHGAVGVLYSLTLSIESLARSAAAATAPVILDFANADAPGGATETMECLVPPKELDAYLKDVRALAAERRVSLERITVRRYLPDDHAYLCWARREWAGVELRFSRKSTLCASVGTSEVRRALLAAALAHGGSFHIREPRDASRSQLEACYPMLHAFLREKRRGDPGERLQNDWLRGVLRTLRAEPCRGTWRTVAGGRR